MNNRKARLPRQRLRRLMKANAIIWAIVWATTATISGQQIASDPGVAQKIRELESTRFDAQRRKDSVALDAMLDNALTWVDPDGVQRAKADYMEELRTSSANIVEIGPESINVHVLGTTAVVYGIYSERGVRGGRPYVQRARFINTWALKHGKWVCIAATATSTIS